MVPPGSAARGGRSTAGGHRAAAARGRPQSTGCCGVTTTALRPAALWASRAAFRACSPASSRWALGSSSSSTAGSLQTARGQGRCADAGPPRAAGPGAEARLVALGRRRISRAHPPSAQRGPRRRASSVSRACSRRCSRPRCRRRTARPGGSTPRGGGRAGRPGQYQLHESHAAAVGGCAPLSRRTRLDCRMGPDDGDRLARQLHVQRQLGQQRRLAIEVEAQASADSAPRGGQRQGWRRGGPARRRPALAQRAELAALLDQGSPRAPSRGPAAGCRPSSWRG